MQSITGSVSSLHDSALTLDHLQLSDPQTPFEIDVTDLSVFTNMIELYATNNVVYGDFSTLSSLTNIERLWLSCRDGTEDFCGGT